MSELCHCSHQCSESGEAESSSQAAPREARTWQTSFDFFPSVSREELGIGWLSPECAMPGRDWGKCRQRHHCISYLFECGGVDRAQEDSFSRIEGAWVGDYFRFTVKLNTCGNLGE